MLNQDAPEHTRLRGLVSKAFTPERIKGLEGRIEEIVDELIDTMQAKTRCDFVPDFAIPLPAMVIAGFMGVPFEDHITFCNWSAQILAGYDSGVSSTDNFKGYETAIRELSDYFTQLIALRRISPSDDLISSLIEAHDKHDRLTGDELLSMCMLLLVAGHETTTNLLSSGLLTFFNNPDQLALLKQNPQLLAPAVEEMLRYESPLQRATFRITTRECVIGGKELKEGEQVVAVIGAANRDPAQFSEPDCFDITRDPNRHLAFGVGIHVCLGAYLARLEGQIALRQLTTRLPSLCMNGSPVWNDKKLFRGLKNLPVTL